MAINTTQLSAGTIANVAGANPDWSNASNAGASDNSRATVGLSSGNTTSDPLRFTNFDFSSIPENAIITGIGVSIEARSGPLSIKKIDSVQLVDGGSVAGTLDDTDSNTTTEDVVYTRGGDNNDWGYKASLIRSAFSSTFGFQVVMGWVSGASTGQIDHATLDVYWQPGVYTKITSRRPTRTRQRF